MDKKIFLLFFALILLCAVASAKSYSLEKADIKIRIEQDALVHVQEDLTFNFSGSYTYAYRDFEYGDWEVENIQVLENNYPVNFDESFTGSGMRITWHFSATNEKRIFTIKYDLKKAVTAYNDVAEFYWKVWGSGWAVPLRELYGTIELPMRVADPNEVYTYGHPQLNGKIAMLEKFQRELGFGLPLAGQSVSINIG